MMICVPIKKKSLDAVLVNLKKAQRIADLVEIWFDEISAGDQALGKIFSLKKKPFIYKVSTSEKLKKILNNEIDYIDLDFKTPNSVLKKVRELSSRTKIILSYHDFKKTPGTVRLRQIFRKMLTKKPDIIKIATFANVYADSLRMLSFLAKISHQHRVICLCMGAEGKITRMAGHLLGNYLMYAPLKLSDKTAEGQITAKELWDLRSA